MAYLWLQARYFTKYSAALGEDKKKIPGILFIVIRKTQVDQSSSNPKSRTSYAVGIGSQGIGKTFFFDSPNSKDGY
jgi:hypothetical protein